MANIQNIQDELTNVRTVNLMAGVLRDIAASRTRELRGQFRHNVAFYKEVRDLYAVVRGLMRQREIRAAPLRGAWGILVTSNVRFYGGLNRRVIEYYLDHFEEYQDHLVIGNTGSQYIAQTQYFSQCDYKSFQNDLPQKEEMRDLIARMREYDRVDIYYPAYKNPFQQEPASFDINAAPETPEDSEELSESFLAEPELKRLNDFFSTHVKWALFQRIILETDLSRASARLMKMHSAEGASDDMMKELNNDIQRQRKAQRNIQLLESIIALKQWQKMNSDT